ncbi:lasso peptide biosynthesis B2 protein [Citromicrobium bathyomarinum]|uniref:lasso peptide biosynthesis B2 protein n=1 Tax=Citromicrobium bathyomarinum TaxID=72174 RepID=UPI00315A181D
MTANWSRLQTFARMEPRRRALVLEAMAMLGLARAWLVLSPFRNVARTLGSPTSTDEPQLQLESRASLAAARDIRWAIALAASRVPFRAVCLQQAVAAKLMLRRRGIPATVRFGLAPAIAPDTLPRAHAWVSAGKVKVAGFPIEPAMVVVARFD